MLADDFCNLTREDVDSKCAPWSNPFFILFCRLSNTLIFNSKSALTDALRDILDLLLLVILVKRAHFI